MIVCSCNALSEARIEQVLAAPHPPRRVLEVHHRLGCRPQCGCCARGILAQIRAAQAQQAAASQAPRLNEGSLTEASLTEACLQDDVAA